MSQVYSTEPKTTGRVILNTTHGPIDIRLFCKEAPTTCRLFLQLCLDGFYDNLIFHRILENFLIQTGHRDDSKSRQEGLQESYNTLLPPVDVPKKKLEIIPRIKFNHRGQVAWALPLDDDSVSNSASPEEMQALAKQLFITLDEAPFLNKRYVILGTIQGDTIFNALRIGKSETIGDTGELVDKQNAPKVKDVRIVEHMFDDLVATKEQLVPWKCKDDERTGNKDSAGEILKKRRKKRKGKKDLNVLSFGAEMEDVDDGLAGTVGMKSSHDLAGKNASSQNDDALNNRKSKKKRMRIHTDIASDDERNTQEGDTKDEDDADVAASNGSKLTKNVNEDKTSLDETKQKSKQSSFQGPSVVYQRKAVLSTTEQEREKVQAQPLSSTPPKMSALEARRMKYPNRGTTARGSRKISKERDDETLSKLSQFKTKMFQVKSAQEDGIKSVGETNQDNSLAARMARKVDAENEKERKIDAKPCYSGQILEDDGHGDEAESSNWLKSSFKCRRHIDHDSKDQALSGDGRKMDDYEVVDDKQKSRKHGKVISSKHHQDNRQWR